MQFELKERGLVREGGLIELLRYYGWGPATSQSFTELTETLVMGQFQNNTFSIRNNFISSLVLDNPKFKKLIELQVKKLKKP